jgi:biotin synthase
VRIHPLSDLPVGTTVVSREAGGNALAVGSDAKPSAAHPAGGRGRAVIAALYHRPLLELLREASAVHSAHHWPGEVQVCVLLSVKTGGCPEDCAYCPQSARYHTAVDVHPLLPLPEVAAAARRAREAGATRFCMGAAWREVSDGPQFDRVLEMVRAVKVEGGLEVCCTLGMLSAEQARRLKDAGVDAYNHNLDTSPEFYGEIIQTRVYEDRLRTLRHVREAGISVCCGGILGMGESDEDRIGLLHALDQLPEPPESVPINALVPVAGTPLERRDPVDVWLMARMIATARILFPRAMVRLSAGRLAMSDEAQALCFLAGANSIFAGEKLLTTPNPGADRDARLFERLGLAARPAAER